MSNKKPTIGILGGMGPMASADMFLKFIKSAHATSDQTHIPLIISSIPDIPDRSAYLLSDGADPYPYLYEYTHNLVKAGADCMVIACNTAHYWFDRLQADFSHITMLSMIDVAVAYAKQSGHTNIGILATNATLATNLYKHKIQEANLNYIAPEDNTLVMQSIYDYKAGRIDEATTLMQSEQDKLFDKGASALIMGCTEVPLILANDAKANPNAYIDATQVLVDRAIAWYREAIAQANG
ncbi:amino acid racemase [Moraxella haemolytica]|uniref:aspartate/glutamate racemase family protein n=1 Tax=Moraxella TaxID=475 RepID=UPI002543124D|nr:amino acid racemase [Moraxella sp. ZY171148]WII94846.1 amino acid racemase [Moraxella sp. ZY171148]